MTYTTLDIKEASKCAIWYCDPLDLKQVQFSGQDLYIRVSAADSVNMWN
ncbi:hypothetical protein SLEP1_g58173 [Rubroshorea leprosula]|uniref:Uncharacterized protein n=1 Tax=Rubroshorea leprosula TaxID=152421 RepID=A0AAV5MRR4_9ROSI|nr:hypothetical protein SLEP1_g58173 [Rubroshorea leprosula]